MEDIQSTLANNGSRPLQVATLPLFGTHLIEASAGTGKTYNITRIYLRMLLERELTVEQILVMTFTNDATQELKGRIEATIRHTLSAWSQLIIEDTFFQQIAEKVPEPKAKLLLRKALLYLDEASIFTIHGFCQRVLGEYAFNTGMAFNAQLQPDISKIVEQATQDWYRNLAQTEPEAFLRIAEFWSTPAQFLASFSQAIMRESSLECLTEAMVIEQAQALISQALAQLYEHSTLIHSVLIEPQKGDKQQARVVELAELTQWLTAAQENITQLSVTMPSQFFNGTRYARSPHKDALNIAFAPVKALKKQQSDILKSIQKAKAYAIVAIGIEKIKVSIKQAKGVQNVLSFDDLITALSQHLATSPTFVQQVKQAFPVALVDEFQDTDPTQFAILSALYHANEQKTDSNNTCTEQVTVEKQTTALYMIGDPKQAIYGFRGGDVFAYLNSRQYCQYQWLMDTNWRSSADMISAYNRLFYGAPLTQESGDVFGYNIPYQPVKASPAATHELADNSLYQALQFIHFIDDESGDTARKKVGQDKRQPMADWCSNEIMRLLARTELALQPQDFAILVRDGTEALSVKTSLSQAGLASVYLSNRQNLFESAEAKQLFLLLQGLYYCDNERLFSQLLASPLLPYHAKQYYDLQHNPARWQTFKLSIEKLRELWINKGLMAMAFALLLEHIYLPENEQERCLTNLIHLFETIQLANSQQAQPHQLLHWLQQHVYGQVNVSEAELRLESDDNLIKIVTQHGCKGLEYPVVFIPFASRYKNPLKAGNKNRELIEYHNDQQELILSLGGSKAAQQRMLNESHAETIRLFYVAITRAKQRCYVLSTDFADAEYSPLGCTLNLNKPLSMQAQLENLAQTHHSIGLHVQPFSSVILYENHHINSEQTSIKVNIFNGSIERDWWLSSFTALTRNMTYSHVSQPDHDEVMQAALIANSSNIRFTLTKGAQTGNFLHDIFEQIDFCSPNWEDVISQHQIKYGVALSNDEQNALTCWLDALLHVNLASAANNKQGSSYTAVSDFCLADLTVDNTLRECEFYFPMENIAMYGLKQALLQHRQKHSNQSLQHTAIQLPMNRKLKGMMHGFIDLIFTINGKYYVCDYKSNHLGEHFSAYCDEQLQQNIQDHYYDLQYLIYSVALHRYLTLHLPDYQPTRDFGGVYYFYLRGMQQGLEQEACSNAKQGQENNSQTTGVFYQHISADELTQLDNLFKQTENINA